MFFLYLILLFTSILTVIIYKLTKNNKKIIISIEGNIGAGKSTLLNIIKENMEQKIYFVPEPVDIWLSLQDDDGNTILSKFYQDKKRWSYTFQNLAFITRLQSIEKGLKSNKPIVLTERSVFTDKNVFAATLYNEGNLTELEYNIYNLWFKYFKNEVHYYIYLNTNLDNCVDRIKKRNRKGEENIDRDYLEQLQKLHNDWLFNTDRVIHINGNIDFLENITNQKKIIRQIEENINNY